MLIKHDHNRDVWNVWVKASEGECQGCEHDGDYSLVFKVVGGLVSTMARKTKLAEREAVALLFRQYHRSR